MISVLGAMVEVVRPVGQSVDIIFGTGPHALCCEVKSLGRVMPEKLTRKTAMISSTSLDLPEHRQQAMDACLHQSIFPCAMEHLPARDADAINVSLEMVDEADIYIGIYAWRYGHVPAA